MDVLLLDVESGIKSTLRKHIAASGSPKVRFYAPPANNGSAPEEGRWDLIILDRRVRGNARLADSIKKDRLQGLKIVLTEKESLRATMDFWGEGIYSYILKPVNRQLFHLVYDRATERVRLNSKLTRLEKQQKKQRAGAYGQKEVLEDLFVTHLKMQELDQEKTNFLARTSHELRTPLTALQGYLDLMARGKTGALSELQSDILNRSLDSCRRLLGLANSLMDLSALSGMAALQIETRSIRECLYRAVAEVRQVMDKKGMNLKVECQPGIPDFRFDMDRMQQVLVNLLDNSLKYTPSGGTIAVSCEPYFQERRMVREMAPILQERRANLALGSCNSIRLQVTDTGAGIPAEYLQDIFEEYSRVILKGTNSPKGFGLGLAVARRIVVAHEGKIWAKNNPDGGSCFTVLIPIST